MEINSIILWFPIFVVSIIIAFFIPGYLLLRKSNFSLFQKGVVGTILGMVLWGWQGFILGYLKLRFLSYFYILIVFLLFLRIFKKDFKIFKPKIKIDLISAVIIFLGTFMQVSTVWFNGILLSKGLFFCCGDTRDNLYHIALTNELVKHFPPFEPDMYGILLKNYHYFGNLVSADLIRVFHLPLIASDYQFMTIFISFSLGLTSYVFSQVVKRDKSFIHWLLFFLYFGGDLIFLLLIILGKGINFDMSSLEDGSKFLWNLPRAYAVIVFFAGLSIFLEWLKEKSVRFGIILALLFASLVAFKVYLGIFSLAGFGFLGLYFLLIKRYKFVWPLFLTLILSLVLYLPVNSQAGGLYFTSFWIFEDYIVQPYLGLSHLELARRIFLEHNNWFRVALYEALYIVIYIPSIFGTKLIGLFQTKRSLSLFPKELNIFLLGGLAVSAVAGFFFQQTSGTSNTFNFLVSIFIIGSIYTALAINHWSKKINKKLIPVLTIIIIILTVPRVLNIWSTSMSSISKTKGALINAQQIEALNFLRYKTPKESLVLVNPDSFFVEFLADRNVFIVGRAIIESHSYRSTWERTREAYAILNGKDSKDVKEILKQSKINYIYLPSNEILPIESKSNFLKQVFENKEIRILKVVN